MTLGQSLGTAIDALATFVTANPIAAILLIILIIVVVKLKG